MDKTNMIRLAKKIKECELTVSKTRMEYTQKREEILETTDFVELGIKLAKDKEIYINAEASVQREEYFNAVTELNWNTRLYEIYIEEYKHEMRLNLNEPAINDIAVVDRLNE